jgi:hypothetical protein
MLTRREALHRTAVILGGALGSSTMAGVLAGCRADPRPDWTPQLLTNDQALTVGALVDHLLPKSGTPGARELLVDRFIDGMLKDYASAGEQQAFTDGLTALEARCRRQFDKGFVELSAPEKDTMFRALEDESPALEPNVWGGQISESPAPPTFYRHFKQLALLGYYTSERVGEQILKYDPVPGRFDGCVPVADIGGAWSL